MSHAALMNPVLIWAEITVDTAALEQLWLALDDETPAQECRDAIERIAAHLAPLSAARPGETALTRQVRRLLDAIPTDERRALAAGRSALECAHTALRRQAIPSGEPVPEGVYRLAWPASPESLVLCHAHLCEADALFRETKTPALTRRALAQIRLARELGADAAQASLRDDLMIYLREAELNEILSEADTDYARVQGRIHAARESVLLAYGNLE